MKLSTIKIPESTADMNMSHLPFFMALSKFEDKTPEEMTPVEVADMLCIFFNSKEDAFDKYTVESNYNLFLELCGACSRHKSTPIQKSYKLNGTKYNWINDYSTVNTAYHRDISKTNFINHPLDLLAFCYIEEGMTYNQLDESKQIINPRRARGQAFKDVITLEQYLNIQSFFLSSFPVLKAIFESQQSTEKRERLKNGIGKTQSIL